MINNISNKKNMAAQRIRCAALSFCLYFALLSLIFDIASAYGQSAPYAKYVILMIADGWGQTKIDAANMYTGSVPLYQTGPLWTKHWMTTYPYGCDYNPAQAWGNFSYVINCVTDSAAAATALYSGIKTQNSRLSVSFNGVERFFTIGEMAKTYGAGVGAITTVPVTDATPGAMVAHNDSRANYYAIADEGFFGDPNTTGAPPALYYGGGHGPTFPAADVLIGDGRDSYVSIAAKVKLRAEKGSLGDPGRNTAKHYLVERQAGQDAGESLMQAAVDPYVTKLAGLFDQVYRKADGSGYDPENPTLSESTEAALTVLGKNPNGFVLMIEGGAIDWAGHANNLDYAVGEMIDFNEAVQTVIDWIDDPSNDSNWNNTLLIVTGDHETGYLTAGPGRFPDQPLGPVNSQTLSLEKIYSNSGGRRASWDDWHNFGTIDSNETVYWAWNTGGHANILIPLYTSGVGSGLFENCIAGSDPVRGDFIDNTNVAAVMESSLSGVLSKGSLSIIPDQNLLGNPIDITKIVAANNSTDLTYTVTEDGGCQAQTGTSVITKKDTWKYNGNNLGNIGTTWKDTGYDDSGWSSGSGIFGYGETYINTLIGAPGQMSVYFRKIFTVCDPSAVNSLKLNATYDDGIVVYINGTQVVAAGVTGNPPVWNGGATNHESNQAYQTFNLDLPISHLVVGTNVIAVGIYNVDSTSSDLVFDGELVLSNNGSSSTLFTGSSTQAQSVGTAGWTMGVKNIKVSGSDVTCLAPLADAIGTFNFVPCDATGSLSIVQGQELSGNPVDLTSIVNANNATNMLYTVTEGPGCPAQVNESIITKRDAWKYDMENTGPTWMNAGYNDTGWSSGGGVFGTEPGAASYGYSIATPVSNTYKSMFFRKTFDVCNPAEVTALKLNALYDDGMVVYINGTKIYSDGVTGDPPPFDGGAVEHEAVTYETKDLAGAIGLNALSSLLVPGSNVIAVGVYNRIYPPVPPDPPYISSDIVWDGELVLSQNMSVTTLFTGNALEAHAVNTAGWTEGTKDLHVSGNDATCFSPLTGAAGAFIFEKLVSYYCDGDGDTYVSAAISGSCTGAGCAPSGCQANAGTDCNDSNSTINPAAPETCNNVDDNCNGFTDENLTRPTTCGVGICSGNTGVETCSAGAWGNNTCNPHAGAMMEGPPGDQTCMDNLDNDCDGAKDMGDIDCHVAFELNCFDGIDDDADGMADCADPDCAGATNGVCATGQPGTCSTGTLTCQAGASVCAADNIPQAEVCDGLDNNCDGAIDENLTRPTTCGMGVCAGSSGIETCSAGVWGNNTCNPYAGALMEGPPGDQSCSDNLDNDCDGVTDIADGGCHVDHETNCYNGIDDDADGMTDCGDADCAGATNGACVTGQPGTCSAGTLTCQAGAAVCVAVNMPQAEVCDGLDNDCDGSRDEGCDDDGDGHCDNTMTVSGAPVPVCILSTNGPGDDCNDNDSSIYPGGPPVRIAGTLPEYFMSIQPAYSSPASIKVLQTQGAVLQEDLLFDMNKTVTFEAGYDCGFSNINGKTTVNGNMIISGGVVTISSGTLELK
jgi:alkaline phosphatase